MDVKGKVLLQLFTKAS